MSTELEKIENFIGLLTNVDVLIATARAQMDTIIDLIQDDYNTKLAAAMMEPGYEPALKKAKLETLDMSNPKASTWTDFFDFDEAVTHLDSDQKKKAKSFEDQMLSTYRNEAKIYKNDTELLYPDRTTPLLRGIVGTNMIQGRNQKKVRYVGMIGFLTHYNVTPGHAAQALTNAEFAIAVKPENHTLLLDWRLDLEEE